MSTIKSKEAPAHVILGTELVPSVNEAGTSSQSLSIDQIKDYMDDLNVVSLAETATEGGLVDCTSALDALVTLHGAHTLYHIPPGDWLFSGGLSKFTDDGIYIIGSPHAPRATRIHFEPSATGVCFEWDLTQATGGISGFWFTSTDTNYVKTAIKFTDGSNFHISNIHIGTSSFALTWGDATGASIGINGFGREVISIHTVRIFADKPMVFGVNPNHVELDIDQWHIYDTYLVVTDSLPNAQIEVVDLVNVYQFTIDGYNAWAKGRYGLYWHNTTGTGKVSHGVKLSGIRCEQGYEGGGDAYLIYLEHAFNAIQQLSIEHVYGDIDRTRGIYIKGAREIRMADVILTNNVGGDVPLEIVNSADVDVSYLSWDSCTLGNFGGTVVIPDTLRLIEGVPAFSSTFPLPMSAKYLLRKSATNDDIGVSVAESMNSELVTKNYLGATLIAAQTDATGDLTIDNTSNTIVSAAAMDFTGILSGHRVYLNTALNATTYLTAASDSTVSTITFVAATVVDEVGVNGDVVHGLGLWHRASIEYIQKTNITAYAPSLGGANMAQTLDCASGKLGNSNTTATNSAILEAHDTTTGALTPDIITYTAITSPATVFNNLTGTPSIVHIAVEQINF